MTFKDWNIPVGAAMFELAALLSDDRLQLTDRQRAAIGAGRMALIKFAPERPAPATEEMVHNALLGCPKPAQEAMTAAGFVPATQVAWMIQRALATYNGDFNRHRRDPEAIARRYRRR